MPAVGDFVRWCIKGEVAQRDFIICLDWRIVAFPSGMSLEQFTDVYVNDLVNPLIDVLNGDVFATSVSYENLTNPNEFREEAISVQGTAGGNAAPPFVAYGGVKVRTSRSTKSGNVRLPGVVEDAVDGNGLITSAQKSALESALPSFISLSDGVNVVDMQMVIIGRDATGELDLTRTNDVSGVEFTRATTQNSRKYYKGR